MVGGGGGGRGGRVVWQRAVLQPEVSNANVALIKSHPAVKKMTHGNKQANSFQFHLPAIVRFHYI